MCEYMFELTKNHYNTNKIKKFIEIDLDGQIQEDENRKDVRENRWPLFKH